MCQITLIIFPRLQDYIKNVIFLGLMLLLVIDQAKRQQQHQQQQNKKSTVVVAECIKNHDNFRIRKNMNKKMK